MENNRPRLQRGYISHSRLISIEGLCTSDLLVDMIRRLIDLVVQSGYISHNRFMIVEVLAHIQPIGHLWRGE